MTVADESREETAKEAFDFFAKKKFALEHVGKRIGVLASTVRRLEKSRESDLKQFCELLFERDKDNLDLHQKVRELEASNRDLVKKLDDLEARCEKFAKTTNQKLKEISSPSS